jgi:hypothetical protein
MERKIIVFSTCRSFIFPGSACRSYLEKYRPITTLSAINVLLVVKCLNFEVIIIQNTNQSRSKRTVSTVRLALTAQDAYKKSYIKARARRSLVELVEQ